MYVYKINYFFSLSNWYILYYITQVKYIAKSETEFGLYHNGQPHNAQEFAIPSRGFVPVVKEKVIQLLEEGKKPKTVYDTLIEQKAYPKKWLPTLAQIQQLKSRLAKDAESILGLRTTGEMLNFLKAEVAITRDPNLLKEKGKS